MTTHPDHGPRQGFRVLLVSMPWAIVEAPSLGLGTLKAILSREGIACDVYEPSCVFARQIGISLYSFFSFTSGGDFRGESFFAPHYFDLSPSDFTKELLRPHYVKMAQHMREFVGLPEGFPEREFLDRCEEIAVREVPEFLATCVEAVDWSQYDIIGFTLMFAQTVPSLCVARWIKNHYPDKTIIFGGPSCEGEMGLEMLRSFPQVDFVVKGEADTMVTQLVRTIRGGFDREAVPGIAFRKDGCIVCTEPAPILKDLDWLPVPDFSDYFASQPRGNGFASKLFFESSRGCWWGQKSLCTFCGLNANGLDFRRKSPSRVVEEILSLEAQYGISKFDATDNIMDAAYFQTLLPKIKKINDRRAPADRLSFFYEVKANMRKEQMRLMAEAGVREAQPGIESFNDNILERMEKGASGIQQIQFIKWATELGIKTTYGILHSNPNDRAEDYREMAAQIDFLEHLIPPIYVTATHLDRFSPHWRFPEQYGIREVKARQSYQVSFPDSRIDHDRLAYRFDYDHDCMHDQELRDAIALCQERIRRWRDSYQPGTLVYDVLSGEVIILDYRGGEPKVLRLDGAQAKIFLFCDHYATTRLAAQHVGLEEAEVEIFLDSLVSRKLVYRDQKGRYLSLPVRRSLRDSDAGTTHGERGPAALRQRLSADEP
jgi:ribosomal peptide maturation radical SAM protein 1